MKRRTFLLAPATTGQLYPTDQPFYFPAVDYLGPLAAPAWRAKLARFLKFLVPIFWNVAKA